MTDLTCRELIDFLDDYRSGALAADRRAAFDAHLAQCRHCRDYLRTYEDAIKMGRSALGCGDKPVPAEVPRSLVNMVMDAVRKSKP